MNCASPATSIRTCLPWGTITAPRRGALPFVLRSAKRRAVQRSPTISAYVLTWLLHNGPLVVSSLDTVHRLPSSRPRRVESNQKVRDLVEYAQIRRPVPARKFAAAHSSLCSTRQTQLEIRQRGDKAEISRITTKSFG